MIINEQNYVQKAESVIKELAEMKDKKNRQIPIATTSQIRNILAMSADIYNMVMATSDEALTTEIKGKIEYLKIRMVYEAGRDPKVKAFIEKSELLNIVSTINGSKKNYVLFNHYLEALVAYRKYLGGKEQ